MTIKILIAAFLTLLATTAPALAQGNGNGNGNAGNNGIGEHGNNGNGNGNVGNGSNGVANGTSGADDPGAHKPPTPAEPSLVPEADILSLVKSGKAVSLVSLLPSVLARTGGQIIDAQLVRTERILIYAVKVLTPDGRVGIEYYNARSGTHIEAR